MEAKANLAYREGCLDEARDLLERMIRLDPRTGLVLDANILVLAVLCQATLRQPE